MGEYELAALAIHGAGNWIAAAHVAVGLIQAGIVWIGIRGMQRAGDRRATEQDQRHAEAMAAQRESHVEAMVAQRESHAEAMVALRALIVRTDSSA